MKLIFLTLFLALIASSSALGFSKRSGKPVSVHSLHLEKISVLGSALKGLIQLADAGELEAVVSILSEVLAELNGQVNQQFEILVNLQERQEAEVSALQESIQNLNDYIRYNQAQYADNQQQEADLQNAIEANNNAIVAASNSIQDETDRRSAEHSAYEEHASNVRDAIQALKGAQEILQQLRDEDLAAGSSFLQIKTKKFAKSLVEVEKKLSKTKLKLSTTDLYIKQLVLIAQDVEASASVNADTFDQIFNLLAIFEQSLEDELQKAGEQDQEQSDASQQILQTLAETVSNQQAALQSNTYQLSVVQDLIAQLEVTINRYQEGLSEAENQLNQVQQLYSERISTSQQIRLRLEADVDTVQRALVFVQTESASVEPQIYVGEPTYQPATGDEGGDEPQIEVDVPEIRYGPEPGNESESESDEEAQVEVGEPVYQSGPEGGDNEAQAEVGEPAYQEADEDNEESESDE